MAVAADPLTLSAAGKIILVGKMKEELKLGDDGR